MRHMFAQARPTRLALSIAVGSIILVSGAVLIQGLARDARAGLAAITQTPYCIYGNGDGGSWTWTI